MKTLDKLIKSLTKIRERFGNVKVRGSGFLDTNNGFMTMRLSLPHKDSITDGNVLNLHFELSPKSRKEIVKGIEQMEELGYTYYPSQFVKNGESPKSGVSPCESHVPW